MWQPNVTESLMRLILDDLNELVPYCAAAAAASHFQGFPTGKSALQSSQRTFSGAGAISIRTDAVV